MPQLDITINLIWYFCSIIGLSVLYLQNVYIYVPFFIRYWKFNNCYSLYMVLFLLYIYNNYFSLINSDRYYVSSCTTIPYVLNAHYSDHLLNTYRLDIDEYEEYTIFKVA